MCPQELLNRFWILDAASINRIPLSHVLACKEIQRAQLNMKPHNMSREKAISLIHALASEQSVSIDHGHPVRYSLTKVGGAEWEHLAQPKWEKFWMDSYDEDDDGSEFVTIECHSSKVLDRIQQDMNLQCLLHEPVKFLVPWEATYWKSLTGGVRRTFRLPERPGHSDRVWCKYGFSKVTSQQIFE